MNLESDLKVGVSAREKTQNCQNNQTKGQRESLKGEIYRDVETYDPSDESVGEGVEEKGEGKRRG